MAEYLLSVFVVLVATAFLYDLEQGHFVGIAAILIWLTISFKTKDWAGAIAPTIAALCLGFYFAFAQFSDDPKSYTAIVAVTLTIIGGLAVLIQCWRERRAS